MIFSISKADISQPATLFRRIGYLPIPSRIDGKASFIRRIHQTDFPRFHMYVSQTQSHYNVDLHMDLLRPQHQRGSNASENVGKPIEDEIARIMSLA
jgi:hypothetical protein